MLVFNFGQLAWPAPGIYHWHVYVDEQPEPLGRFTLSVTLVANAGARRDKVPAAPENQI